LVAEVGLDGGFAAVAVADLCFVGFFFDEEAGGGEVFYDFLSGGVAFHAGVFSGGGVQGAVGLEDVD
jgi:hypothetical protein